MIRIYTREGPPHGYYDTDSLGLRQAEAILEAGGVYRLHVTTSDREGLTLIPAREVIRVKDLGEEAIR